MKSVVTLGDAVELAFVALILAGLAIGVAVQWARERKQKARNDPHGDQRREVARPLHIPRGQYLRNGGVDRRRLMQGWAWYECR